MLYTKSGRSLWQITSPRWEPTSLTARRLGDNPSRTPPLSNFRHCSRPSWNNQEVQFLQKLAHIGCSCWRMKELEMFECLTIDYRTQSTFPTIIITLEVSTSVWQGHRMIGDYWLQQWIKICLTNCPKKCKWWHFDKKKKPFNRICQFCNLMAKICQTNILCYEHVQVRQGSNKNCKNIFPRILVLHYNTRLPSHDEYLTSCLLSFLTMMMTLMTMLTMLSPVEDVLGSLFGGVCWLHSSSTKHVVDCLQSW